MHYVKICPKCKSSDINMDKSTLQQLGALPTMYICSRCKFSGYAFPEIDIDELENLPEDKVDVAKNDMIDTSYGKFQVKFIWKIIAPINLLLGLEIIFRAHNQGLFYIGLFFLIIGMIMFYISYFKKRLNN